MSVITFIEGLRVQRFTWFQQRRDLQFRSIFGSQGREISAPLWKVSIEADSLNEEDSNQWQALALKLRGQTNQLELWNIGRPTPQGTMRGNMSLNTAASQGDNVLSIIAAGELTKTLKEGDFLGIGTGITQQVVMVVEDATSDGSGVISVTVEPPLRSPHLIAASVVWDKPKALFRLSDSQTGWSYTGIAVEGFTFDLLEDWRS